jgi:hypothetical protein
MILHHLKDVKSLYLSLKGLMIKQAGKLPAINRSENMDQTEMGYQTRLI